MSTSCVRASGATSKNTMAFGSLPFDEQGHPRLMAVTQQEIENRLWDAADELRVAMPEAQYSSVVFPLMFWKYLSDTWEYHHQEFLADNEGLDDLSAEEA